MLLNPNFETAELVTLIPFLLSLLLLGFNSYEKNNKDAQKNIQEETWFAGFASNKMCNNKPCSFCLTLACARCNSRVQDVVSERP